MCPLQKAVHITDSFNWVTIGETGAPVEKMAFTKTPWARLGGVKFRTEMVTGCPHRSNLAPCSAVLSKNISRIFESPDDVLALEALTGPPSGYRWLPTPQKRMEVDERDMRLLESSVQLALRTSNFTEACCRRGLLRLKILISISA